MLNLLRRLGRRKSDRGKERQTEDRVRSRRLKGFDRFPVILYHTFLCVFQWIIHKAL